MISYFEVRIKERVQRELQEYRRSKKAEKKVQKGTLEGMKFVRHFDKWQQSKRGGKGEESYVYMKTVGVCEIFFKEGRWVIRKKRESNSEIHI